MRSLSLLIAGSVLGSCTMGPPPPPPTPTAAQMHEYDRLLAGKVAQAPINCVPNYRADDMVRLDGRTLGFRVGGNTTYLVRLSPGCEQLANQSYVLVSKQFAASGMCRSDIQQVVDPAGLPVGSCVVEDVIPYVSR